MQPIQPEAAERPDVPKLKPTVLKTVAELGAECPGDPDVHLRPLRSTISGAEAH